MKSGAKRVALILTLVTATLAIGATALFAQSGVPNPFGGTCLRRTVEETSGPAVPTGVLSRGMSIDLGLQSWLNSLSAYRPTVTTSSRPVVGSRRTAVMPRRVWVP